MIKDIRYSGYTSSPSDYECSDGELAGVMNFIPEDGTLKPVVPPETVIENLETGTRVIFAHKPGKRTNYIVQDTDGVIRWNEYTPQGGYGWLSDEGVNKELYQVNAIGNTIMLQFSNGIHYFLWEEEKGNYLYLGTHLPELPVSFGLQGEMIKGDGFTFEFDRINKTQEINLLNEFSDNNKNRITSQVLAKVNKFLTENTNKKGRFFFPFFVRYAYRLYDGSLTMHSMPVLMVCSSDVTPNVYINRFVGDDITVDKAEAFVLAVAHQLDYACNNMLHVDKLKEWGDIVRSVDVFVSAPIYTYDQSGQCTRFLQTYKDDSFAVCKLNGQKAPETDFPINYMRQTFTAMYMKAFNTKDIEGNYTFPDYRIALPRKSTDTINAEIRSSSVFYKLKSIKLNELSTQRTVIEIEEGYLQSLVSREVMSDDYDSHDRLVSKYSFAYNQRLNLANMQKTLWTDFYGNTQLPYTNDGAPQYMEVYFFIKQDGREIVVKGQSGGPLGDYSPLFLYYPNVNCHKAVIRQTIHDGNGGGDTIYHFEVPMEEHASLNAAFFFGDWEGAFKQELNGWVPNEHAPTPSTEQERTVSMPNKIYTSDVNNPFRFAATNINTIGTGTIIGMATAAKALSQGQFGQFPLYAFTTDGVWALEVSGTGTFSAKQPITRDICINRNSITQIDSAVLFATERGIMMLSGSESRCISDAIDTEHPFNPLLLPHGNEIVDMAGFTQKQLNYIPFRQYLKRCGMLYDYNHQRIIIYNPECDYAYIYSVNSKAWGMMPSDIANGINAYPEALAMTKEDTVINLSQETTDEEMLRGIRGVIFTRPFKLDSHDILKTVDTIIQRGIIRKDAVRQVLYGSRDLLSWHLVWSSKDMYLRGLHGTPYKYFRLALITELNADESLYGFTCQFRHKLTNKPR
ncbi:MAG: hypothetical protein SPF56_08570 [Bacteroidaceae bacterium]|nr:hypothetical protein [Bacteroidaceae bacterium]